jgi:tetratricopeptide (TPR) repeat protein
MGTRGSKSVESPSRGLVVSGPGTIGRSFGLPFLILLAILTALGFLGPVSEAGAQERTPVYWYEQGRRAYLREDYYRAIESYRTALELSPVYSAAIRGLAESYFALQEFGEALEWVEKAERYERGNLELKALKGRILIGLGRYAEARELFDSILEEEPYNDDALFGLAELDIARGRLLDAQAKYRNALRFDPRNRRALLSLALIYDARGEIAEAEELIELALHYYPSNEVVQYLAASHYYERGMLDTALTHARRAGAIDENYPEAVILESRIHFQRADYDRVVPLVGGIISENRDNPYLWYLLGRSYDKLGNFADAREGYSRAFRAQPDDEISRMSLEQMIIRETEMDDPLRERYAAYHLQAGRELERRNYYLQAMNTYRRALRLDPFSEEGRLLYANIFRSLGYPERYLAELRFLEAEGFTNQDIEDDLEIYESLLEDSLARRWNIRQYPAPIGTTEGDQDTDEIRILDRTENGYSVALFYDVSGSTLLHPGAEPVLAEELYTELEVTDWIIPSETPREYDGYAAAFSRARGLESDYFAVVRFQENERVFAGRMQIYRSSTGSRITEYPVIRTGNNRVRETITTLAEHFADDLPMRGSIIDIRFDTGLVDLGSWDGIETGDVLDILKKGGLDLETDELGLVYRPEELIGTLTITEIDELVSAGTIESSLFFDMINPGDQVVLADTGEEAPEGEGTGEDPAEPPPEPVEDVLEDSGEAGSPAGPRPGSSVLELYREILRIR